MMIVLTTEEARIRVLVGFAPEEKPHGRRLLSEYGFAIRKTPHSVLDILAEAHAEAKDALANLSVDVDGIRWEIEL